MVYYLIKHMLNLNLCWYLFLQWQIFETLTLFFLNSSIELSVKNILHLVLPYVLLFFTLNFAGGYREVEIPSPIPNLEVKHFIADNTAGSPGGNVGRCQLLSFLLKLFSIWTFSVLFGRSFFFSPDFWILFYYFPLFT